MCLSVASAAPVPPRPATAAPAAPPAATNLESFGKISDRNIFNANRFVVVRRVEEPTRATRAPVIVESLSLLGTLESAKGPVAFFEGSSPSHRKAAKLDESIAGCKITGIEPNLVLAPMEGVTDLSFRRLVRSIGAVGLTVTEFIASEALRRGVAPGDAASGETQERRPPAVSQHAPPGAVIS